MMEERLLRVPARGWRIAPQTDAGTVEEWSAHGALPEGARDANFPCMIDRPIWLFADVDAPDARIVLRGFGVSASVWINGARIGPAAPVHCRHAVQLTGAGRVALRIEPYSKFAWLEGVSAANSPNIPIHRVVIQPDLRRKRITVAVKRPAGAAVCIGIEDTPHSLTTDADSVFLEFPDFTPWTPDAPKLYVLRCELFQDSQTVDVFRSRFGMREFTIKEDRFSLNGRLIYLKGANYSPLFDPSVSGWAWVDRVRREVAAARHAGFNFLRVVDAPAPEFLLDAADELGMLIGEGPASLGAAHFEDLFHRDANRPSVVMWTFTDDDKENIIHAAASLDPSRVAITIPTPERGGAHAARYSRAYRETVEDFDGPWIHLGGPADRLGELYYENIGNPDRPVFISDFGYAGHGASIGPSHAESVAAEFQKRDLGRIFQSVEGFAAVTAELQAQIVSDQLAALRANTKTAGYCYGRLADRPGETQCGLLDAFGHPKLALEVARRAHAPLLPVIHMPQTNLIVRQDAPVEVLLLNEERLEGRVDLSLQVVGPTEQVLWKKRRSVNLPKHGKELWAGTISASGSAGPHRFVVRLIAANRVIAEAGREFHVFEPVGHSNVEVHVLDPLNEWSERCERLARLSSFQAPVHIIPPLANTIRAYPDNDLAQVLGQVRDGAVAIMFSPPPDWNDLAAVIEPELGWARYAPGPGVRGAHHYAKLHPVFEGLPARCLLGSAYRNVLPPFAFIDFGEDDICGGVDLARSGGPAWFNNVLIRRYGGGRVVFTHLRILEHLGQDPVADRLFVNLLKHLARRSLPAIGVLPVHQRAVEWMRAQRLEHLRRWMIIGPFPNWGGAGHDAAYPPELAADFEGTYPGWYRAVRWKRWYSRGEQNHEIDLTEALAPVHLAGSSGDWATAYAYAEFAVDRRVNGEVVVESDGPVKVWLNGELAGRRDDYPRSAERVETTTAPFFRQGRNTLLIKTSKAPGPFRLVCRLACRADNPPDIKWWR